MNSTTALAVIARRLQSCGFHPRILQGQTEWWHDVSRCGMSQGFLVKPSLLHITRQFHRISGQPQYFANACKDHLLSAARQVHHGCAFSSDLRLDRIEKKKLQSREGPSQCEDARAARQLPRVSSQFFDFLELLPKLHGLGNASFSGVGLTPDFLDESRGCLDQRLRLKQTACFQRDATRTPVENGGTGYGDRACRGRSSKREGQMG